MSTSLLGNYFDLHGGGEDLKFPHHENEIAQSCAACDSPFVHIWMHNGFVRVNEEKMSKSLGNFFTVREVLKTLRDPEVLRFFLLSSHYRGPINYSAAQLAQADETLLGLYRALKDTAPQGAADAAEIHGDFAPPWTMISIRLMLWRSRKTWPGNSILPKRRVMHPETADDGGNAARDGRDAGGAAAGS